MTILLKANPLLISLYCFMYKASMGFSNKLRILEKNFLIYKMGCPKMLLFLYPCLIQFLALAFAQSNEELEAICHSNSADNQFSNSTYSTNIDQAFKSVVSLSSINNSGFFKASAGQNPDQVNAIALCRGDINLDGCYSCVENSTKPLRQHCPNSKEAFIWYDNCMLRYSDRYILNSMESGPNFWTYSHDIVNDSDVSEFKQTVYDLLEKLTCKAASGGSLRKFATGKEATKSNRFTIYALAQCTPDISKDKCCECLNILIDRLPECCFNKTIGTRQGARILSPSCNFRYEVGPFYDPTLLEDPPLPPCDRRCCGKRCCGRRCLVILVAKIAVPTIFSLALLALIAYYRHKLLLICARFRRKKPNKPTERNNAGYQKFTIGNIRKATNNFSNKIGEGGFGCVYKGILPGGQEVAVKKLSFKSQGEAQFENEVKLLARLHHRNLVRLLGFCFERNEKLLVYEFIPNSSLHCFMFDEKKRIQLVWKTRYKIIVGIARGLVYLHEDSPLRIIHRDLKLSNILLDEYMEPKIADFGMAKLFALDQSEDATTNVMGTFGYMAPEYINRGVVSMKSDVYSYGVVLLEIISGRSSQTREQRAYLLVNAWDNWNKQSPSNIIDPILKEASRSEILRCIQIAFLCLQEFPEERPDMKSVTLMLDSDKVPLPKPSKPGNLVHIYREQRLSSFPREIELAPDAGSEYADSAKLEKSVNEVPRIPLEPR